MNKYDIFFSYCRIDREFVLELSKTLRGLGLKCFLAEDSLQGGDDYASTIQSAIIGSKCIIYVYGKKSEDSIGQRRELDLALDKNKKIISILKEVSVNGLIYSILQKRTNCIKYTRYDDIDYFNYFIKILAQAILIDKEPIGHKISYNIPESKVYTKKWSWKNRGIFLVFIIILCLSLFYISFKQKQFTAELDTQIELIEKEKKEQLEQLGAQIENQKLQLEYARNELGSERDDLLRSEIDSLMKEYHKEFQKKETQKDSISITNGITNLDSLFSLEDQYFDDNLNDNKKQKLQEHTWMYSMIIFLVGIVLGGGIKRLLLSPIRKKNVKISSDVNVSISIDNIHKKDINAGDVYSTYLSKGEYIIDFKSKDNIGKQKRIIHKIADKNTHVIFSDFLSDREIKFKCFIAGSIALSAERDALRAVMAEMYNQWESDRFRICSYTFEDFNRDVVIGGQQKLYDAFIEEDADWVVFIISDGIGEKTLNEYHIAMNSYTKSGHPKILFLAYADSANDKIVLDIKKEIVRAEQYWNTYNNIEHMKSLFYKCINWDVTLLSKRKK